MRNVVLTIPAMFWDEFEKACNTLKIEIRDKQNFSGTIYGVIEYDNAMELFFLGIEYWHHVSLKEM